MKPKTGQTQVFAMSEGAPQFLDLSSPGVSAPTSMYHGDLPPPPPDSAAHDLLSPRRTTDEVEAPPPRRGPAVFIGLIALAASALVVVAQAKGVPPLALVQHVLDFATGSAPPATAAVPPAPLQTAAQPETRLIPVVTASDVPPRPQVGSLETPSPGDTKTASTSVTSPSSPARPADPARPSAGKRVTKSAKGTTRVAQAAPPAKEGFGYVSIGAKGAGSAKVSVDGRDIGYSPVLAYKVKLGSHNVKLVPYKDELPGKAVSQDFVVTKENTPGLPLRLVIEVN